MRNLTGTEISQVSGGISIFGVTQIAGGSASGSVGVLLVASFSAGYAFGTALYDGYVYLRY